MNKDIAKELKSLGLISGYNGFSYMCWIREHYNAYTLSRIAFEHVTTDIATEYNVSSKAVLHNLTLLLERSWENNDSCALRKIFGFRKIMPTLKEFVSTIIILTEKK